MAHCLSKNAIHSGEYGGELPAIGLLWALESISDNDFRACF